jgi:outer membrane protein assembly factor BamE (lipoprotein component of BamABCDE complex)
MLTTEEARQIREGMSQREVVEQYGKPIDINTTRTRGTVRQQYVYRSERGGYDRVYVYFEDYVVTSVQY